MSENNKAVVLRPIAPLAEPEATDVQSMAQSILPMWPKECTPEQARNLARLAILYGLDPFAQEIIPYRGRPYITIWGRIRKAQESNAWEGIIEDRAATDEEMKALGAAKGDTVWFVSIKRAGWLRANGRYGRVKITEDLMVKDPALMARKRALNAALKEAFNIRLQGVYDDDTVATMEQSAGLETTVNTMVTQGEIAAIHAVKTALGYSDEAYRDALEKRYGVRSSTELTQFQAQDLLQEWGELAEYRAARGEPLPPEKREKALDVFAGETLKKPEPPKPTRPVARGDGITDDTAAIHAGATIVAGQGRSGTDELCHNCGNIIKDWLTADGKGKVSAHRVIEESTRVMFAPHCHDCYLLVKARRDEISAEWLALWQEAEAAGLKLNLVLPAKIVENDESLLDAQERALGRLRAIVEGLPEPVEQEAIT